MNKDITLKLGLNEGDKFDIYEKDRMIYMLPVMVYPKKYIDELRNEINETKTKIQNGGQPTFE